MGNTANGAVRKENHKPALDDKIYWFEKGMINLIGKNLNEIKK